MPFQTLIKDISIYCNYFFFYILGEWGICDDTFNCPIPPRRCGEPVSTRKLPDSGKSERGLGITQLPWMVALGIYDVKEGEDVIEVNPRTGVRFAEEFSGFTTRAEFEEPCEQINRDLGKALEYLLGRI